MNDIVEKAAERLLQTGSHHGWFRFRKVSDLDPIRKEELLSEVERITEPFSTEITRLRARVAELEGALVEIIEVNDQYIAEAMPPEEDPICEACSKHRALVSARMNTETSHG